MKHKRSPVCLLCIHTAACLMLSSLCLVSCNNAEPADTTASPSDEWPSDTTSTSIQNNTYNNNYYVSAPGGDNQAGNNQSGNNSGGNVTTGGTSNESNESKGLAFTSNGNGTCTLTGLGTCQDACVVVPAQNGSGERVVAISEKAFYGNTTVTAVFLPSSITSIGSMAFSACPSLSYFSVDSTNTSYRSEGGVLYTYDRSVLVAYPAAKATNSLTVSTTVRTIADMAFYGCSNLRTLIYEGTSADWQQVSIGAGNNSLFGLSIRYNSAAGK